MNNPKYYRDLKLRDIREKCGLDFAHYTYKPGQCSCCYGPEDMASIHWKNREIRHDDNYTYILFKNADNGSGHVTKNDYISNYTCIEYRFVNNDQKEMFCKLLSEQLGEDYIVAIPYNYSTCITIFTKSYYDNCIMKENNLKESFNERYYLLKN